MLCTPSVVCSNYDSWMRESALSSSTSSVIIKREERRWKSLWPFLLIEQFMRFDPSSDGDLIYGRDFQGLDYQERKRDAETRLSLRQGIYSVTEKKKWTGRKSFPHRTISSIYNNLPNKLDRFYTLMYKHAYWSIFANIIFRKRKQQIFKSSHAI